MAMIVTSSLQSNEPSILSVGTLQVFINFKKGPGKQYNSPAHRYLVPLEPRCDMAPLPAAG